MEMEVSLPEQKPDLVLALVQDLFLGPGSLKKSKSELRHRLPKDRDTRSPPAQCRRILHRRPTFSEKIELGRLNKRMDRCKRRARIPTR